MVGEFVYCAANIWYNSVQLMVALDLDSSQQPFDHGKITAVIWYHTPDLIKNRDTLLIYFGLNNDFSLRRVVGLPTLLALGGLIDLLKETFVCSELDFTFPLTLDPPDKVLSESAVFDNSTPIIP